jgi:hypothetical protein
MCVINFSKNNPGVYLWPRVGNIPENIEIYWHKHWNRFVARTKQNNFVICEYDIDNKYFRVLMELPDLSEALQCLLIPDLESRYKYFKNSSNRNIWNPSDWIKIERY